MTLINISHFSQKPPCDRVLHEAQDIGARHFERRTQYEALREWADVLSVHHVYGVSFACVRLCAAPGIAGMNTQ